MYATGLYCTITTYFDKHGQALREVMEACMQTCSEETNSLRVIGSQITQLECHWDCSLVGKLVS